MANMTSQLKSNYWLLAVTFNFQSKCLSRRVWLVNGLLMVITINLSASAWLIFDWKVFSLKTKIKQFWSFTFLFLCRKQSKINLSIEMLFYKTNMFYKDVRKFSFENHGKMSIVWFESYPWIWLLRVNWCSPSQTQTNDNGKLYNTF